MAKVAIVLYKSKTYKTGHPVLLRVTHRSKPKYYTLKQEFVCSESQWNNESKEFKKSFGKNYTRANLILTKRKTDAQRIILDHEDQGKPFSFDSFEKKMFNEEPDLLLVPYFDKIITGLLEIDKIKNAEVYKTTRNVMSHFLGGKDILMRDFDYKKLMSFEQYLRKRGNKDTTISNRMRTLRAVYNKAKKEEGLETYPFTNYNFGNLNIETRKRALPAESLNKMLNYTPQNMKEQDTILLFTFMFYCKGINYGDLARLKKDSIINETILYRRKKSKKEIRIKIHKDMQLILDHFKNKGYTNKYLLPILHEKIHKSEQQKVNRIRKTLRTYNTTIKKIAKTVGIEKCDEIATNVMRHSWATGAREIGISESIISESMGHKDLATTRIYLADFDEETINEANRKVADILNK